MMRWVGRSALSMLGGGVLLLTAWWAVGDAQKSARIRELEQVVNRLKTERRVAQLFVSRQIRDDGGKVLLTTLEFKEYGRDGQPLPTRNVQVVGDIVFVDALVVRFTDEYVERGDALRGHSLHLFRRIFGEHQQPIHGEPLDQPREVPAAYRTQASPGEFERKLWERFWEYAASPEEAARVGVRVAQGEAVYQRVREGQMWRLATRADGGLEFSPENVDPMLRTHLPGGEPNSSRP